MSEKFSVDRKDASHVKIVFDESKHIEPLVEHGEFGNTMTIRSSSEPLNNILVITRMHEGLTVAFFTGLNFPINTIHCSTLSVSGLAKDLANSSDEELLDMFNVKGTHREENFLKYALCVFSTLRSHFDATQTGGSLK